MPKMLDLFAGTRSVSREFEKAGWETYSVEWDKKFKDISLYADISKLTAQDIIKLCGGRPDVIWASPDCFVKGTLVWTDEGYKPIEEIKCKDMVLTHKGNYKRVYRTIKKNTYAFTKLKISGVEELLVTPNHPFYARKKIGYTTRESGISKRVSYLSEPEWIDAEKLSTEYRVGIPINTNAIIPVWDGFVRQYCNSYGPTKCEIINTLNPLMSCPDFWWVVGNYFADGSLTDDIVTISYGKNTEDGDRIKEHLEKCGIKYSERTVSTSHQINIPSTELVSFLGRYGKGSMNKAITPEILNLPVELLREFLDGYFKGDGMLDHSTNNPQMKYTTVSKKLAYGLSMCILKAYRRYPSIALKKAETINNKIEGRTVNVHDAYVCGFYLEDSNRLQYAIEDNMAWVNVRSVENVNTEQQSIYTLSVEDDESYTAYNVAVHNCTSYSVSAISHHRQKVGDTLRPISEYAMFCDRTNNHVLELIAQLKPKYFFIENPRAGMRKMEFMRARERAGFMKRYTVTYCQYGDFRMKPTDIWTNHPNPQFKPPCNYGDSCHEHAPRGSVAGSQRLKNAKERARIPEQLCRHIVRICSR